MPAGMARPPMPSSPAVAGSVGVRPPLPTPAVASNTARPPFPMPMRPPPPMPVNGSPANAMAPRPPLRMPAMAPRPPAPISLAIPNFARPQIVGQVTQRPPMPSPAQLPSQRTPLPSGGPSMPLAPGQRPPSGAPATGLTPGMNQLPPRPSPPLMPRPPSAPVAPIQAMSTGKPSPFSQAPSGSTPLASAPGSAPAMGMRPPMPQANPVMRPPPPRPMVPIRPPSMAAAPPMGSAPMNVPPPMGSPNMMAPLAQSNGMPSPHAPIPSSFSQPPSPMKSSVPMRPQMQFASQISSLQQSPIKSPQLRPLPTMMTNGYSQQGPSGQPGQYPQAQAQLQQGQRIGQYNQLQPGQYSQAQPQAQYAQSHQPGQYPQQQQGYPNQQQQQPGYPQHPQPGQFQQAAPQQRVNPAAIPSVVAVLEADRDRFKDFGPYLTYTHVADHPPPLPTTSAHISVLDDGNSAPTFIRTTMNHVPATDELCENSKIPLALLFQPFAHSTEPVSVADLGELGPVRCNRCRAYINPHCQFIKGGRAFVCNLCEMTNEVPEEYYANLDMNGKRIDLDLRPELRYGTVDFVATKVKKSSILEGSLIFHVGVY